MPGLVERQSEFVVALREAGLTISVAEGLDAVRAMQSIDLLHREQLRAALAATLVKRPTHRRAFDATFDLFYPAVTGRSAAPTSTTEPPARAPDAAHRGPNESADRDRVRADLADYLAGGDERLVDGVAREAVDAFGAVPGRMPGRQSWSRLSVLSATFDSL